MMRVLGYLLLCLVSFASQPAAAQVLPEVNVAALAVGGERLYVGGFDQGLFTVEPGRAARPLEAPGLSPHVNCLAWSASEQALWVGTARGLARCDPGGVLTCRRIGPSRAVHAVLVRESGELVAGMDDGLLFVRGELARPFGKKQRAPFRAVWALAENQGKLYVGATNGLFWGNSKDFRAGTQLSRASVVQGDLADDWVTALLAWGESLYVGTYNGGVASFVTVDGKLRPSGPTLARGHVNPEGIVPLSGDALAVCSMEGLWKVSPSSASRTLAHTGDVTALARLSGSGSSVGGYWLGTRRGLVFVAESLTKK